MQDYRNRKCSKPNRQVQDVVYVTLRGYRLALRDVQHTIEVYAIARPERNSAISAVLMTADQIAAELWHLRAEHSAKRRQASAKEDQLSLDMRTHCGTTVLSHRVLFDHGYRTGLDRAQEIVTAYGLRMNDPDAGVAIAAVADRLAKYKLEIADCEPGQIRTVRAMKYAFLS
ncbi:hypothetical protein WNZ14_21315 [Hoeflea sp. AS60]|uniref:hypothetical protein n=1 Tax=Hoeflea sp. AS60 TaxID=3135780 RepID=UPI00316BC5A6